MKFFKKRKDIFRDEKSGLVYLKRWNLFECKYFSIKIHNILLTDFDCYHDHPWAFFSLILKGGYVEYREIRYDYKDDISLDTSAQIMRFNIWKDANIALGRTVFSYDEPKQYLPVIYAIEKKSRIYHPLNFLYRKANDRHRLEIHQPCWSFVITFKKVREWGFWTKLGFVHWIKYDSNQSCE